MPPIMAGDDFNMTRERCVVGEHATITDYAVVRNVRVNHKQVVAAHFRQPPPCAVPRWMVALSRMPS